MTNGQKVITTGLKYVGVHEVPMGSNSGPYIDGWEARWGLHGQPWCNMYTDAMFSEAKVDDDNVNTPSTEVTWQRAVQKGDVWDGKSLIPEGAMWVVPGTHICFVTADLQDGTVKTLEGNHMNAVLPNRRYVRDGKIIIVPSVKHDTPPPAPKYEYWIEDTEAKQKLFQVNGKVGVWSTKAARDKRLAELKKSKEWAKYHPRAMKRLDSKKRMRYYIIMGPLRYYGPFNTKEMRDSAKLTLEKKLNRKLRSFNRKVKS